MTGLTAALPLLAVLTILMLPGTRVLLAIGVGLTLVSLTSLLPMSFFLTPAAWLDAVIDGLLTTVPVAYVLLGGITLAQLLRAGGALDRLSSTLLHHLPDPLHRILALIFGIAVFFESVTGFGVGAVVCAPIFVALGYAPWRAATLSLLGLCAVTWGALAIGTSLGATLAQIDAARLATLAVPLSLPYWLAIGASALWVAQVRGPPARLFLWLVFYVGALALALLALTRLLAFELAGALAGPLVFMLAALLGRVGPRKAQREADRPIPSPIEPERPSLARALLPLAVLLIGLTLLRIPGPAAQWAAGHALLAWPARAWQMAPLGHPGTWMLIAAGVALVTLPNAQARWREQIPGIWRSWRHASIVVAGFLVFASIMSAAGMTAHLARALSETFGAGTAWLIAPIAALGGFLTGSNTGSNAMLMQIQLASAHATGLPVDWSAAAQNTAGANATFASPGRLILASHLSGCPGSEGRLLRLLLPAALAGTLGVAIVLVAFAGS
ncbi:MAG: L-lactate permease [Burkholderiaceae bacterium]